MEEIVVEERPEENLLEDDEDQSPVEKHKTELKIWSDEDEFDSKHNSRFKLKEKPPRRQFGKNMRRARSTDATALPRVVESLSEENMTVSKHKTKRFHPVVDLQEEKSNRIHIYRSCTFQEDNSIMEEPPNTEDIPENSKVLEQMASLWVFWLVGVEFKKRRSFKEKMMIVDEIEMQQKKEAGNKNEENFEPIAELKNDSEDDDEEKKKHRRTSLGIWLSFMV